MTTAVNWVKGARQDWVAVGNCIILIQVMLLLLNMQQSVAYLTGLVRWLQFVVLAAVNREIWKSKPCIYSERCIYNYAILKFKSESCLYFPLLNNFSKLQHICWLYIKIYDFIHIPCLCLQLKYWQHFLYFTQHTSCIFSFSKNSEKHSFSKIPVL